MLTFEKMKKMTKSELLWYLSSNKFALPILVELANKHELPYSKAESKNRLAMCRTLANQISGMGVFERIAGVDKE